MAAAAPATTVVEVDALSGYLFKKARNDKWQRRWFETQGYYLVYYKNRKMEKLLAALSLPQVGEIRLVPIEEDPERQAGLFALELNNRVYTLRAPSNEEAELWVRVLLKLREQGQQQNELKAHPGSPQQQQQQQGGGGDGGGLDPSSPYVGTEIGPGSPSPRKPAGSDWVKKEKKTKTQQLLGCCPC